MELCGEHIQELYGVSGWPDSEPTKLLYRPKQKLRSGRGTQTDKLLPPSIFTGQYLRKSDFLVLVSL
jgi:hypothetical protein